MNGFGIQTPGSWIRNLFSCLWSAETETPNYFTDLTFHCSGTTNAHMRAKNIRFYKLGSANLGSYLGTSQLLRSLGKYLYIMAVLVNCHFIKTLPNLALPDYSSFPYSKPAGGPLSKPCRGPPYPFLNRVPYYLLPYYYVIS
jgi:hypothetical protein